MTVDEKYLKVAQEVLGQYRAFNGQSAGINGAGGISAVKGSNGAILPISERALRVALNESLHSISSGLSVDDFTKGLKEQIRHAAGAEHNMLPETRVAIIHANTGPETQNIFNDLRAGNVSSAQEQLDNMYAGLRDNKSAAPVVETPVARTDALERVTDDDLPPRVVEAKPVERIESVYVDKEPDPKPEVVYERVTDEPQYVGKDALKADPKTREYLDKSTEPGREGRKAYFDADKRVQEEVKAEQAAAPDAAKDAPKIDQAAPEAGKGNGAPVIEEPAPEAGKGKGGKGKAGNGVDPAKAGMIKGFFQNLHNPAKVMGDTWKESKGRFALRGAGAAVGIGCAYKFAKNALQPTKLDPATGEEVKKSWVTRVGNAVLALGAALGAVASVAYSKGSPARG